MWFNCTDSETTKQFLHTYPQGAMGGVLPPIFLTTALHCTTLNCIALHRTEMYNTVHPCNRSDPGVLAGRLIGFMYLLMLMEGNFLLPSCPWMGLKCEASCTVLHWHSVSCADTRLAKMQCIHLHDSSYVEDANLDFSSGNIWNIKKILFWASFAPLERRKGTLWEAYKFGKQLWTTNIQKKYVYIFYLSSLKEKSIS